MVIKEQHFIHIIIYITLIEISISNKIPNEWVVSQNVLSHVHTD